MMPIAHLSACSVFYKEMKRGQQEVFDYRHLVWWCFFPRMVGFSEQLKGAVSQYTYELLY